MYPGQMQWGSPVDPEKFKQIDSLRQYFPTVKEVTKDSLYEIPIQLPNRKLITLRVNLPKDFPRVAPAIQIYPPVQHRYIDQQMFVTPAAHENLSRWSNQSNLGKTMFEVIQKLNQDPPQILTQPTNPAPVVTPTPVPQSNPPPYPYGQSTQNQPPSKMAPPPYGQPAPTPLVSQPKPQVSHVSMPPVPANFAEIEAKTPSELTQLVNDETEFKKFFEDLPQVQNMRKVRDDLRNTNEDLAKKNLAKEAEIEKLKREISSKQQLINDKRLQFEQKAQRQQEVMKQFSTPALIEHLGLAAQQAETESDAMANKFLSGEMDYKDFLKEFIEKRKLYHLRAAKKESLMMMTR